MMRRQSFWTLTVKPDTKLLLDLVTIWEDEITPLKSAKDFQPVLTFEPTSTSITSKFSRNGGNALGITAADGPLIGRSSPPLHPSPTPPFPNPSCRISASDES